MRYCFRCFILIFCFILFGGCRQETKLESEKIYIDAVNAYTSDKLDEALILTHKALALDKQFYQAALLEVKILFFQGEYEKVEKKIQKLLKKYPEYTEARIWYIRNTIFLKDFVRAESLLERELSFNQTDWRVYYLYAVLGAQTENYDIRLSMSRRAEWALTDSAKVYMDLAQIWNVLGVKDRAGEYLLKSRMISGSSAALNDLQNALDGSIKNGLEEK